MSTQSAVISECGKYRYSLTRIWDESKARVLFIMLNPSTADDIFDDPTIRRCVGFAKSWGYGGLYVANLFAYRSPNPCDLIYQQSEGFDIVGCENDIHLMALDILADCVVFAWGRWAGVKEINERWKQVVAMIPHAFHLGLTKEGHPKHPLYLKKGLTPIIYEV